MAEQEAGTTPSVPTPIGPWLSIEELYKLHDQEKERFFSAPVKLFASVKSTRVGDGGKIVFIDLRDGFSQDIKSIGSPDAYLGSEHKCVFEKGEDESDFSPLTLDQMKETKFLSQGCSVVIEGIFVKSPEGTTQLFELQIHQLSVVGGVEDPAKYPITKSNLKQLASLRQLPFDRMLAEPVQYILQIDSEASFAFQEYLREEGFVHTPGDILTSSCCEGAGEMFKVDPQMFGTGPDGKPMPVGLTVSSQMPLEKSIDGLRRTYVFQKSFRAEKSDTSKHLCEFRHLEIEAKYIDFKWLLDFTEKMLKAVIKMVFERCAKQFDFLEGRWGPSDTTKGLRKFFLELCDRPFVRIKHAEAVQLIQRLVKEKVELPEEATGKLKRVKVKEWPTEADDLASEHEKLLVTYFGYMQLDEEERKQRLEKKAHFGAFVAVTHWPFAIKSFYMKQCSDGTCEAFDLLAPFAGELFGGSMREWRHSYLEKAVQDREMDPRPIQWYLDLRKTGAAPHGGWGMGFDRFLMMITGAPSVRDVVMLPVYYQHCPY
uniref:Aminoacyl-transfer RNA synthetases class-II family profile domain-containing protein n=1 Tax=Chromera velia CCMP2878 TaxID=1169474 RepID=A0A0G4EZY7_9ALVE|eukprot:Cvel_14360.t1-p1 / transcript=Cvel_14360.t1 / gene=Cvel_14360 / organism=Chromera_velia_CCMP2878 / gene_product=Asparagine--tRNA ligase, putative / transcript_product=Asparagine--tRNA ligase, putative / location=Cvel_scaffold1018:46198-47817(+) / protein_length=540 / sequence_SO=supercontig / SO=protein_coding / is_pseudo=false